MFPSYFDTGKSETEYKSGSQKADEMLFTLLLVRSNSQLCKLYTRDAISVQFLLSNNNTWEWLRVRVLRKYLISRSSSHLALQQ